MEQSLRTCHTFFCLPHIMFFFWVSWGVRGGSGGGDDAVPLVMRALYTYTRTYTFPRRALFPPCWPLYLPCPVGPWAVVSDVCSTYHIIAVFLLLHVARNCCRHPATAAVPPAPLRALMLLLVRCVQFHAQQGGRGLPAVDLAASVLETLSRKGSDPGELQVH